MKRTTIKQLFRSTDLKNGENELQKITDEYVKKIDEVAAAKSKEIMEI